MGEVERSDEFDASGLDLPLVRALFERLAVTSLGARAVRELGPRSDDEARAALARCAEMQDLERGGMRPSFAGVTDLRPIYAAVHGGSRPLDKEELAKLFAFVEACPRLAEWVTEHKAQCPTLAALLDGLPSLAGLRTALLQAVDERGELRDDASPRLARLRREVRELEAKVQDVVTRIASKPELRSHLTDFKVHRRGGRRALAVKAKSSGRVPGLLLDRSHSGETVFVEPRAAVELSSRLVDVEADIRAEEARILVELTRLALEHEPAIVLASRRVGEWELAWICASFCREFGARCPEVASAPNTELVLRGARHPLLVDEQRAGRLDEVIAIDVRLGGDFDLLVITGPNTGGKTLALKTVGIAAWCARHGLPACCAEQSRVPLYAGLVVDIGDEQEISQSLSTFASHLKRICAGLERAGPATLFLLDELGGGTDPAEGAALGDALLEWLLERRTPTIATTHLGKLKEFCFRHGRAENASVEFDPQTLRPRYRLLIGTPGESNALVIAARCGLEPAIVARARERLERRDRDAAELMDKMRGAAEHTERLRSAAESKLVEVERVDAGLRAQRDELERRRDLVEAEAQRGLEERVRDAQRTLAQALPLLEQLPSEAARSLRELLTRAEGELSRASLTERRRAFLDALDKGQLVFVPRYRQRCVVKKIDRARREVTLQLGKLAVSVPFDEITWYETL
jgi:DNA mismatch repair protein MutS2